MKELKLDIRVKIMFCLSQDPVLLILKLNLIICRFNSSHNFKGKHIVLFKTH